MSRIPLSKVINIPNWRFFIAFYKLTGMWPPSPEQELSLHRRLYFLWAFLLHLFMTFVYDATLLINILIIQNFEGLFITLTEMGTLGKGLMFFKGQQKFQALVKDLFENPIYSLRDAEEELVYKRDMKHYQVIINSYLISCMVVIVLGGLSSIFSDPIALAYPAWFPFDYTSSRNLAYYCIFAYQNCGVTLHCMINLIWDSFMPFLMLNLHSQFRVLANRLEGGFTDPKDAQRTRQELIENILHYNSLIRLKENFQSFITLPMAYQIGITGIVLCINMMQLVTISPQENLAEFMRITLYTLCMLMQMYLQCYFGNMTSEASADILHATFCGNWLDIDLKNRKLLMMFMIRLRAPARIKTMKIVAMERSTFTQILNMSYSMFAIMRRTKSFTKI